MATPILDKISKDLAYKLQDPVSTGSSDGVRLTADERLGYILRGYRRLLRIITMLYPILIQKIFQSYYTPLTGTSTSTGVVSIINDAEVFDIYCKEPNDEEYFKATFIAPDLFYDVESGQNSFYQPDLNTDMYYWTRISADIKLLPALELDYKIIYRPDIIKQIETTGQGGVYDLDIPTEYQDLLLTLSASEGYIDIGQADMVQMHKNDLTEQLTLLVAVKQMKDKDDDKNTP